ncbi:hypothetical protein ANCCEY_00212 [Ancylostoma ceylanicum]|uniref:Uncharacterized protein n=1 Tax=Ancylostoma ceylanicum TaxID=53326 RepID=A0A0D6M901_9BILA|nr:hypothetical protein ANCCEY_00212 [Ancylostoma ceylanicum]
MMRSSLARMTFHGDESLEVQRRISDPVHVQTISVKMIPAEVLRRVDERQSINVLSPNVGDFWEDSGEEHVFRKFSGNKRNSHKTSVIREEVEAHLFPKAKCLVKADSDNVLLVRSFERLCDETSMVYNQMRTKLIVLSFNRL